VSDHLSDFQIMLLVTGEGAAATRRDLSDHLADCDLCCRRLADAVAEERASMETLEDATAEDTTFMDALVEKVISKFEPGGAKAGERILRLVLLPPDPLPSTALAAKGPEGIRSTTLPTLVSDDGTVLVRFRKPTPEGPFRAYVIQDHPSTRTALAIRFPGRDQVFPVSPEGEVDLVDITADELTDGRLEIELHLSAEEESGNNDP
jgi:hypothetical protein